MIMKKRSSKRMSMKGGRDWKIWRRLLRKKMGPGGVRRSPGDSDVWDSDVWDSSMGYVSVKIGA